MCGGGVGTRPRGGGAHSICASVFFVQHPVVAAAVDPLVATGPIGTRNTVASTPPLITLTPRHAGQTGSKTRTHHTPTRRLRARPSHCQAHWAQNDPHGAHTTPPDPRPPARDALKRPTTIGGGGVPPRDPLPPEPDFIVGKNEIYTRKYWFGPFLVHTLLGSRPPPPPLF